MRALITISVIIFSLLAGGCAKDLPRVMNFVQEPIPASIDGKPYSLEQVQKAILKACRNKGWSAAVEAPGRIVASITIRSRHRAKVEIPFTESLYSIRYLESMGLNYRNGYIHSRYNHWVASLDAEIKKEFGLRTQRF